MPPHRHREKKDASYNTMDAVRLFDLMHGRSPVGYELDMIKMPSQAAKAQEGMAMKREKSFRNIQKPFGLSFPKGP